MDRVYQVTPPYRVCSGALERAPQILQEELAVEPELWDMAANPAMHSLRQEGTFCAPPAFLLLVLLVLRPSGLLLAVASLFAIFDVYKASPLVF